MRVFRFGAAGAALFATLIFLPQLLSAQQTPIAYVPAAGVTVSGSLSVENGRVSIGNNGTIKAGESTATVKLARGGDLRVCASTEVHLSRDTSVEGVDSALMIAMDRGALEASYVPGKYSDVLLTPDLRILISGPGTADLKIRVNRQGDTCVDNHGAGAPYVTVTSQFEGGVYRVQANQRVMFEHGSLQQVVDNEAEPCGCPAAPAPPVEVASGAVKQKPGKTAAANPFPLARSEGLAGPEPEPTEPVVPVGVAHAEVEAPIGYDAVATPNPEVAGAAGKEPEALRTAARPTSVETESQTVDAEIAPVKPKKPGGFFHSIGHFFAKIFGK
ncbi:MAG: hypothetical protein WAM66_09935 [Acidobacteriaceae bacterium]